MTDQHSPNADSPTSSQRKPENIPFLDVEKLKSESDAEFEDLFADRRRSVRRLIEETFADEMMKSQSGQQKTPEQSHSAIPIRFRHAPAAAPIHDVFGDAVHTIFQKLMAKGQPAEYCHWMAHLIATEIDNLTGFNYSNVKFHPDVYTTEGVEEAKKKFMDEIWPTAMEFLKKTVETCDVLGEKWSGIHISADQLKGQRHKQEDRLVAYPNGQYVNREKDPLSLLAIFDGHGGHECSQYAAGHFWETWLQARRGEGREPTEQLEDHLRRALELLDQRMTVRSVKEFWKGGTTAVCCTIDMENKKMAFAWLGDSPGYVMSNLEFRKITREHSPSDPEEARRVEEAGGQLFVIGGELRVNGVLNLTRALGDVPGRPMISNEPETLEMSIEPTDYLVFLACDGVSDVFSTDDLYNQVEAFVKENPVEDYNDLARYICKEAIEAGSADNVSVVIGFLRPPQDVWRLMSSTDSDDDESTDGEED